jgi:hypothetical protein
MQQLLVQEEVVKFKIMDIINILEIKNGLPNGIESFVIFEEQLRNDVIEKAEKLFIKMIRDNSSFYREIDEESYLDDGGFSDKSGYEAYIIWSYVN